MRCLSIAAAAVISAAAFTQIAFAADLPRKAPVAAPIAPPAYSWSGWYAGYNAGGGWSNNDGIDNVVTSTFCNTNFSGCTSGNLPLLLRPQQEGISILSPKVLSAAGRSVITFKPAKLFTALRQTFKVRV